MTTDPKEPQDSNSAADNNASSKPGDSQSAGAEATKTRVKKAWSRFRPVLYFFGFLFICYCACLTFNASQRLRASLGPFFYLLSSDVYAGVRQSNISIPSGKKMELLLSGSGSTTCHVTVYKYDKSLSANDRQMDDPDHIIPFPKLELRQIAAREVKGTVVWESDKNLRYSDFNRYEDIISLPDTLAPGDYFYTITLNGPQEKLEQRTVAGAFRVSDLSLIVKTAPNLLLVRAFNVKTMRPISNASVRLYSKTGDRKFEPGPSTFRTGVDGVARITEGQNYNSQVPAPVLLVESGDSKASVTNDYPSHNWNSQIDNYVTPYESAMMNDLMDIITDKPVYRLGQTVQYKGFLRRFKVSGGFEAPLANESIPIEIRDPEGNTFLNTTTKTGEAGDFSASFTIPADGKTGNYTINPINHPNSSISVQILQYRKPEYEVTVQPEKPFVLMGQKAKAKVTARYFFGGPVAGAQVQYTINRNVSWAIRDRIFGVEPACAFFGISAEDRYLRSNPATDSYSDDSAPITGTGLTNDKGELEIAFDTKQLPKDSPFDQGNQAQNYTVSATITDLSRKSVDSTGDALATPGNFALSLKTDSYASKPGQKLIAKTEAKDYYGKAVAMRNIDFTLEKWTYDSTKNKWSKDVVATASGRTDANGKASAEIQVPADYKGYEIMLCARAKDSDGHEIMDYSSLWMSSWGDRNQEFSIELDKLVYEPGNTVKAAIKLPEELRKKKLIGLASIDGTTILSYKCIDSSNDASLVEFPIKDNYAPQCTLRVTLIDEDLNQHFQETELKIYPKNSILEVAVKPSKDKLEPGETAELNIKAKTADGNPASKTSVVLSLVDESIYAVSEDTHPNIVQVFQTTRPSYVSTFIACPTLDHHTLPDLPWFQLQSLEAQVFGHLNAVSGGDRYMEGAARYSVESMKKGAVAPASMPVPLSEGAPKDAMTRRKAESDGAAADKSAGKEPVIRSDFKDTAFFNGSILTDANGEAKITTKLPDNLTTWRASASFLSKSTAAGYTRATILATKPMVARVSLPRFFTQDDKGVVTAIVHNFTDKEQSIDLELRLGNQFKTALPLKQALKVAAQGAGRFTWPVDVIGDGKSKITLLARGGGSGDALVQDLNILAHTFPAFAYHNGILKDVNGKIELPLKQFGDARGGTGQFTLKISPSAIGPVLGNFDELIEYPYGCTEQTMSRMMPSVVAMQLHKKLALPLSADMEDLFKRVYHASLAKLITHHNNDGGWGWWQGDTSNLYLTAYVMEGFHWLKSAGFTYDQDTNQTGNQWLEDRLNQINILPPSPDEMTDLCYAFYALSLDKRDAELFSKFKATASRASAGPEALSYLTLAYKNLGKETEAKQCYGVLKELANKTWEYVNWEHTPELLKRMGLKHSYDYSYRFTPAETTALAFRAALVMEPENEKYLASIRNWILMQHDEHGWTNTKTTSQVFLALLSDELKMGGKRPSNFEATAGVAGKTLASYLFNQSNRYSTEKILKLQLLGNEDKITITKTGPGNLHYSSTLEYLRRIEKGKKVVPRSSPPDLTVERHFYKLERTKVPNSDVWTTRGVPIDEKGIKTGDLILMKVKIHAPFAMPYIKVEAPLPSGAEVISKQESIQTQDVTPDGVQNNDPSYVNYWWTHQDILDDRIVFFVTQMNEGNAEFQSLLRMEMPGELNANPVSFEGMYTKAIRGYSDGDTIKVTETTPAE